MAKIFITGSADGLGLLSAEALLADGHEVVLHARNEARRKDVLKKLTSATNVLTGDLSNIEETVRLAEQVNALGSFDAVIHNAGLYKATGREIFAVNTLAPYILTCLIQNPQRLIYLSSGLHLQGRASLDQIKLDVNTTTYSDSKLHVLMLAKAISRTWNDVYSNAVNPGWVPTKMGGKGAPDDLKEGYQTQLWLAASKEEIAKVSGKYFFHKQESAYNPAADDEVFRKRLLELCQQLSAVPFPQ
ncbi:MAG TPA: SDR family NAD(P)-dependent oxidoreductase [Cytophagaceae bacterium]